jgi:antitoxin component HigA of HigAB toxin-antitoxin module
MATKTTTREAVELDYFQLLQLHPLKAVRSEAHLHASYRVLESLSVIDEDALSAGQADYLLALTDLIWAYEQQQHAVDLRQGDCADAFDVLQSILDESGMTASDLGRLLGKRQLGSAILRRERQLSKAHVLKLATHFGVSTDLLLRTKQPPRRSCTFRNN